VKGEYAKARQLYERTLSIQERVLGPVHPRVAITLNNIALLRQKEGEYEESGALLERVRSIDEKEYGPIHPTVATDLNNLGLNYLAKGEYAKAESLIRSGLDIREKAFGPNHPDVAQSVANYAAIYYERGDYDRAEPLYMRALKIDETVFGDNSTEVANDLNNLAALYVAKGEYTKAEQRYNRALAINEKALGPDHPTVAQFLNNLAEIYEIRGNYSKAERLYMRALAIRRRTQPRGHPDIAQSLNNLAVLFHKKRDYLKAEALHRRALVIYQRALGPNHTLVANSLNHLASVCRAEGRMTNAITYQIAANQVREYSVDHNLVLGSERQKLLFLRLSETEEDNTISLHIQAAPDNHSACQMALTTVLRRKGRGLEAMSDSLGHVRKTLQPQDQAFLNRLIDARTLLATVTLNGPGQSNVADYRARLQQLEESVDGLEGDLSARSTEFRIQHQPISLEIVQKAIPQGAVLVEFALYRNYNAKADSYGPARYVAYTLAARGEPQWADLGEAVPIEKTIELLRVALSDPKRSDVKELARELDSKTMQPVRKLIGPNRWLLISPDGALNLVPLSSLVDENGQYLIENYFFTYLTSGRDLLRLQVPIAAKQGPLLVANPDFGGQGPGVGGKKLTQVTKAPLEQAQTHLFSQFYFPPLPATAEEGEALRLILPNATLLTKRQATKAALKQVDGPIILHIATHGFFLENLEAGSLDARAIELASTDPARLLLQQGAAGPGGWRVENPLLRSGLALAGANEHKSDDDGIMTALEVSGLSLWGTKLVVLSACDSGVGEVKNGDGVYGLRRALVLAGSESQIMSLWSVNDAATRDLMIDYYKGLQAGQGRSEALRNVQLKMLKDPKRSHPAYWASFIQSGQWKNLDGKE
jgi:CHAT domain-containing protein/Tfp pilus assembly protein PilF